MEPTETPAAVTAGSRNDWRDAVWASDLAPTSRLVALVYADHANNDAATVWVTLARGMERTGMKRHDTWSKAVAELVKRRWLVEVEARTNKRAARYQLAIPECAERAPKAGLRDVRTLDCAIRAPLSAQNVHQTPTEPLQEPLHSPAAAAAACSPAWLFVYDCGDMFANLDADQLDPMDAAEYVEAHDPCCWAEHWHAVVDTLPPTKRAAYLSDNTDLAEWDRIEWDVACRVLAAYDAAHQQQAAA